MRLNGKQEFSEVEKRLFHGTRKTVMKAICSQSFDWRLCGRNGTAYGQGINHASSF